MVRVTEEGAIGQHFRLDNDFNHTTPQPVLANHMKSRYVGDLRDVISISRPAIIPCLSRVQPGGTAVPDGGITAMLLGPALGALGVARRYIRT
jgi:hypothetical protein